MIGKKRGRPKKEKHEVIFQDNNGNLNSFDGKDIKILNTPFVDIPKIFEFYDRHEDLHEKCPKCNDIWRDFIKLDKNTWVCEICGCHFMSKGRREEVQKWKNEHYVRNIKVNKT